MTKKVGSKKRHSKKRTESFHSEDYKIERALIENFISLQKVMTNLSVNFDNLTQKLTKLLDLFEISARAMSEKDFDFGGSKKENQKIMEKLENLADQNKTIARGLTLLHEPKEEYEEDIENPPKPIVEPTNSMMKRMHFPFKKREDENAEQGEVYHKSITSHFKNEFPE